MLTPEEQNLVAKAADLGLEQLDHLEEADLSAARESARARESAPGILEIRDEFPDRVGYLKGYLASRLARLWNAAAPDVQIDREPLARDMRQFYLDELSAFDAEVQRLALGGLFTPPWIQSVRDEVQSWMGDDSFGSPRHVPFLTYVQDKVGGQAFLEDLASKIASLHSQSPMTRRLRQRIEKVAFASTPDVLGALFELNALAPLVGAPNQLLEVEPFLPDGIKRAEARVEVVGEEVYAECMVLATIDPRFFNPAGFYFRPEEFARKLVGKLNKKAQQLRSADRPALLFVGLNLGWIAEAVDLALQDFFAKPASQCVSAILIADSFRCPSVRLHGNSSAAIPVPPAVAAWINGRESAWCRST